MDEARRAASTVLLRVNIALLRNSPLSLSSAANGTTWEIVAMKRTIFSLAILCALTLAPAALAQTGHSNGSGSGFLNNDIMVGRGGTPGPAELNLGLAGAGWYSGYRLLGAPLYGTSVGTSVSGTILTQPAVVGGTALGTCGAQLNTCGATIVPNGCPTVTQSMVLTQPACASSCAAPVVLSQPAVVAAPACGVCPPSNALIVPGTSAPTLVDF